MTGPYSSRPPGCETLGPRERQHYERLTPGAAEEVLADGSVRITLPDPPHFRHQRSRPAPGPGDAGRARRLRELELLRLGS